MSLQLLKDGLTVLYEEGPITFVRKTNLHLKYTYWKLRYRYRKFGLRIHLLDVVNIILPNVFIKYIIHQWYDFPTDTRSYRFSYVFVDPDSINYQLINPWLERYGDNANFGVGRRNWDRWRCPLADDVIAIDSLHTRFVEDQAWTETELYKYYNSRIQLGYPDWRVADYDELQTRLTDIEELFHSIKNHGYLPQHKLKNAHSDPVEFESTISLGGREVPNELFIAIGHDGEILRSENGAHRLAIAKILEIDSIPAIVQFRHEDAPALESLPAIEVFQEELDLD